MEKKTTKKANTKAATGCGGCSSKSFDEVKFAKIMVMATLAGKGGNINQIEETANYLVGKVYGTPEG